jgi:hypothetical protein
LFGLLEFGEFGEEVILLFGGFFFLLDTPVAMGFGFSVIPVLG